MQVCCLGEATRLSVAVTPVRPSEQLLQLSTMREQKAPEVVCELRAVWKEVLLLHTAHIGAKS